MGNSLENTYKFTITVGSQQIGLNLKSVNLSVSDSIYELAPRVILTAADSSGISFESRLNILGQEIAFTVNTGEMEVSYPLTCTLYETPEVNSSNGLSGTLKIEFRHAAKFSGKEATGYSSQSPADIFKTLVSQMNNDFNSFSNGSVKAPVVNIDKTSRCSTYPLILNPGYETDRFLNEVLLPLANDGSTATSPFYAYINIENCANFESLKDMLQKSPCRKIVFGQALSADTGDVMALTLYNFSQDYGKVSSFIDQSFTYLDKKHEIHSEDISLNKIVTPLALMKNSTRTNLVYPENTYETIDETKESGVEMFGHRKGLLLDKLVVTTFLDPMMCAGKTVDLNIYLNIPGIEKSNNYSGKYLIESSEHIWNARSLMGYTRLVLGRMSMQIKGKEMKQ